MIYFNKEVIPLVQHNTIMLDLPEDDGHVYLDRYVYDQAVIIADRYEGSLRRVTEKLNITSNKNDYIVELYNILPEPVNILSPFLAMLEDSVNLDIDNTEQMIGVLSVMSTSINFLKILDVPYNLRADFRYNKTILMDYKKHFEDLTFKINSSSSHIKVMERKEDVIENTVQVADVRQDKDNSDIVYFPDEIEELSFEEMMAQELAEKNKQKEQKEQVKTEAPKPFVPEPVQAVKKTEEEAYEDIIAKMSNYAKGV